MIESYDQANHNNELVMPKTAYGRKSLVLRIIRGPSRYDNPSEYLRHQPIEQTPDLCDVWSYETPQEPSAVYVFVRNGEYRFDLNAMANKILPEVEPEIEAHERWCDEVKIINTPKVKECIQLAAECQFSSQLSRNKAVAKLIRWADEQFLLSWEDKCRGLRFTVPRRTGYLEDQIALSIATAASENPIPPGTQPEQIRKLVEVVQRKGIEEHRAHHREYMYWWNEEVKRVREMVRKKREDAPAILKNTQGGNARELIMAALARKNAALRQVGSPVNVVPLSAQLEESPTPVLADTATPTSLESRSFKLEEQHEQSTGGATSYRDPAASFGGSFDDASPDPSATEVDVIDPLLLAAGTTADQEMQQPVSLVFL